MKRQHTKTKKIPTDKLDMEKFKCYAAEGCYMTLTGVLHIHSQTGLYKSTVG